MDGFDGVLGALSEVWCRVCLCVVQCIRRFQMG